jgi:hypothetical protein
LLGARIGGVVSALEKAKLVDLGGDGEPGGIEKIPAIVAGS